MTEERSKQQQNVNDDQGVPDRVNQLMFFDEIESLGVEVGSFRLYKRDTSPDTIWGKFNWGGANWDGDYTNLPVIGVVVNYLNRFTERFFDSVFKDTSSTSTAVTWASAGTLSFPLTATTTAQSLPIHYNNENVIKATIFTKGTTATAATYWLSSDDGSNWETATPSTELTFTNIGQSLKFRIENDGATAVTLTEVKITYKL